MRRALVVAVALLGSTAPTAAGASPWGPARTLAVDGYVRGGPLVAAGSSRDAAAAWVSRAGVRATHRLPDGRWAPPARLGAGAELDLAIGADGTAAAVWQSIRSSVVAAARPAGGGWSAPTPLAPDRAYWPHVGVDGSGRVIASWWRLGAIEVAERPPGGQWSASRRAAETAVSSSNAAGVNPEMAVAPGGAAVVVWNDVSPSGLVVRGIVRPAGGDFGPPVTLAAPGAGQFFAGAGAAVDGPDRLRVRWFRIVNPGTPAGILVYEEAVIAADGTVGAPGLAEPPVPSGLYEAWTVAAAPAGERLAVRTAFGESGQRLLQTAIRPAGGAWGPPQTPYRSRLVPSTPDLAVGTGGEAVMVWQRRAGRTYVTRAAVRRPGDPAFEPPEAVNGGGAAPLRGPLVVEGQTGRPRVAVAADGSVVAAWVACWGRHRNVARCVVQAASREPLTSTVR